ncbi:unnamed protein product [Orchesella dallaii]|uniref:CHK kinase-like domain-containing protein n=1 Tax=Orchesella dallaii TaxID=48710 RepID=A0ABP1QD36_9HEXA
MVKNETVDLPITSSITKEFLEKLLKRKIVDFKVNEGSNPGDNFLAILISLEIHLVDQTEPLYLLYKTFPQHPIRQKLLEDTNLFLKEFLVYDAWFPEIVQFQNDIIGLDLVMKPAVPPMVSGGAIDYENEEINYEVDPILKNFILMVDVRKTWGFKMADKLRSLSVSHVKIVLEELAKFHSLCYAYRIHKDLPNLRSVFTFLNDTFFLNPNQKATFDAVRIGNLELVRETLDDFLSKRPEIEDSLRRFETPDTVSDMFHVFLNPEGTDEEKMEDFLRQKPKQFLKPPLKDQWVVGGHGDCWTNNMLFKTDNDTGKVTDCILVDFQLARESCIMTDLVYFFYTSTDTAFREKHLDEMIRWYFEKFSENCKILKVEPFNGFTLENFQRKFHRSKIFGFLFALLVLPIILQKPENALDMDKVKLSSGDTDEENIAGMFTNTPRDKDDRTLLRDRFTGLLTELYDEGVL